MMREMKMRITVKMKIMRMNMINMYEKPKYINETSKKYKWKIFREGKT
jgi:hypothetical protein